MENSLFLGVPIFKHIRVFSKFLIPKINFTVSNVMEMKTGVIKQIKMMSVQLFVKILKFGTPQTIAIIVLKKEKFDVTLH